MQRRRSRFKHPGVKIRMRNWKSGETTHSAIFIDPDDLKRKSISLTAMGLTTDETRVNWAVQKSRELQRREQELALGAPIRTTTDMNAAIDRYLSDKRLEIRARTIEIYGECITRFRRWADGAGILFAEHLAPRHLVLLRTHLLSLPKRQSAKGGKRGERREGVERRSPTSINRDIRSIKTMLNQWRRQDMTPLLNSDHLKDRLQVVREPQGLKTFLDQDALAKVFAASLRHDEVTFRETRAEHAGLAPVGTTQRYFEVTPFLLTVLLTGCRLGEVRKLEWRQVLLEQGYIALDDPRGIKTGMGRRITLDETPQLAVILAALKLAAGGSTFVFGGSAELSKEVADNCRARLLASFGAPKFSWQMLRRTCGTFLTCADGLYRGSSAWISAARLGHSVEVAQRHYVGVLRNIPKDAKTLEGAMGLESAVKVFVQRRFKTQIGIHHENGELVA